MQIVAHASPLVLEAELCDRVAAAKGRDPLAPVLIVVPSRRLAEHVERRLVERFGAVLGVAVVHHAALARQVLESAGVFCPRIVGEPILETLTSLVVRKAPKGRLADFARDHPGAVAVLRKSLGDLRDAGLSAEAVSRVLGREHAELAALNTRWSAELASMLERGATDHVGLAAMAVPHAEAFARRFGAIVHHGAYELIGVHTDLVNALDRGREVDFLRPARRDDAAPALTVEASFRHVQGATAELATAARGALAAVASGDPPHEVAVVVRSFGPYASAMDALLADEEVRWHTSYARPLRREPAVIAALAAWRETAMDGTATYAAHAAVFEAIARAAFGAER